ncbi:MAG TPA: class II glutamine amidotransferase [Polyangiaceae bacterium]|jgi:glutamine amidotransferase|nr:class II glutamine amidotransferase [Polyangiaceae bacterium]
MCRLFGFRSVIPSQVHRSLLAAENALGTQSNHHPDGWGVAFYVDGAPHVTRNPLAAMGDQLFHRLSGVVSSETVVAHVRKATHGDKTVLNCHPFQYGRWIFAHNGDVTDFARHRAALVECVAPELRRFILGDTDSEVVFFILLTEMKKGGPLAEPRTAAEVAGAVRRMTAIVRAIADGDATPTSLTVLVTNGETLVASHGGKSLFWSSYKARCADRGVCKSLSPECEAPSTTGRVNHFIVSSEPLQGENVWLELEQGAIVGIDAGMRMLATSTDVRALPMVARA